MRKILVWLLFVVLCLNSKAITTEELVWFDGSEFPLLGTLAPDASKAYSRLPDSLEHKIRPEVWDLGKNSAGMAIRFRSDASAIGFKWKSLNKFNMNHMTPTGIRGMDLYALDDDSVTWQSVSSVRPLMNNHNTTAMAMTDMSPVMREYMLYLPLYDGVDSIYIGVDSASVVLPPSTSLPVRNKPIVMYGTSIMQGGCATRPGMIHSSILGRKLNREIINLGFSGNAKLDMEIARLIAQSDPAVIVLDMLPNCTAELLDDKLVPFYEIIRQAHPHVPIVMVESPLFPVMKWNNETRQTITDKNLTLARIFAELKKNDSNLYYFEGEKILNNREGTVDNYHLTDMGFSEFADSMLPLMEQLLNKINN